MNVKQVSLFVPGRLCLFGEHSDWAGMYRSVNSSIVKGNAIVTGTEQGIYAVAEIADKFIMCSSGEISEEEHWECEMDTKKLLEVAQQGGYFSYVAGVASYINDNYSVGGVRITITKRDLPIKSGLSSSAAICVLVARAFNQLYQLKMNVKGEMQAAFRGEQRTPSRCGRLDQACAYGLKPVLMEFDGMEIDSHELRAGGTFFWVVANLMSSKDTIKILGDLNRCYPFPKTDIDRHVQEALGKDNQRIVSEAICRIEEGDSEGLGKLMTEAQALFDEKVMPASEELIAPVLHSILQDEELKKWAYGAKGVGSQGDGTVQFLAKSEEDAKHIQDYLLSRKGMPSFTLTIKPGQTIKKAIIPLAGFGTRVYPSAKIVKKCFMPVLDVDGLLKSALLVMLEQLFDAGVEDIALIIGEDERDEFERFFMPISGEYIDKLPDDKRRYELMINNMRQHITFVIQKERKGFGHAVWLAKNFAEDDPVLLLLGDFIYKSNNDKNCCKQVIEAYKECGRALVSISEVPLDKVAYYGILSGVWDEDEELLKVDSMVEKPSDDYAREYLGVLNARGEKKYYATFGQYVLTKDVFEELDKEINEGIPTEGIEFGLTSALDRVREKRGLYGYVPNGKSFDIGLPEAYVNTISQFYK